MYTAPQPYLPDDPRKLGLAPAGAAAGVDPERMALLRNLYGGPPGATVAPDASADAAPAPDANPYTAPAPAPAAAAQTPEPAPVAPAAPAAPPRSTWHDVQGFLAGFAGPEYSRQFQERDARESANAAAAAAKDPNSAQSHAARANAAPFLKRMGFEDADIARLSAADINSGGGLQSLMKQAAALKAEEAKAREAEATWQEHNATTSGQQDARAHEAAQAVLGRDLTMADISQKHQQAAQEHGADLSLRNSQIMETEREKAALAKEARAKEAKTKEQADLTANYSKANPYLEFRDPELLASAYQSRGKNKLNTDLQQASILHHASADLVTIQQQIAKATAEGDMAKAYALTEKYHLAVNKSADALVSLGGNSSDAAKKAALAKFPSYANPFAQDVLKELQDELDNIVDAKIGAAYGGFVKRGGEKTPETLPTVPVTKGAGPKVNAVVKQGGMLHLSDGSSAPDTPHNRELIKKAGLTFEPEGEGP